MHLTRLIFYAIGRKRREGIKRIEFNENQIADYYTVAHVARKQDYRRKKNPDNRRGERRGDSDAFSISAGMTTISRKQSYVQQPKINRATRQQVNEKATAIYSKPTYTCLSLRKLLHHNQTAVPAQVFFFMLYKNDLIIACISHSFANLRSLQQPDC